MNAGRNGGARSTRGLRENSADVLQQTTDLVDAIPPVNIAFQVWECLVPKGYAKIGELQQCRKEIGNRLALFLKQSTQLIQVMGPRKRRS